MRKGNLKNLRSHLSLSHIVGVHGEICHTLAKGSSDLVGGIEHSKHRTERRIVESLLAKILFLM